MSAKSTDYTSAGSDLLISMSLVRAQQAEPNARRSGDSAHSRCGISVKLRHIQCVMLILLAGCATQRYGRLPSVGPTEAEHLTCEQIEIEKGKARDFMAEVGAQKAKFTGKDVLSFLGDLGIGDEMEASAAVRSASERIVDLNELGAEKGCKPETPAYIN